jgi:hypothetical protein
MGLKEFMIMRLERIQLCPMYLVLPHVMRADAGPASVDARTAPVREGGRVSARLLPGVSLPTLAASTGFEFLPV